KSHPRGRGAGRLYALGRRGRFRPRRIPERAALGRPGRKRPRHRACEKGGLMYRYDEYDDTLVRERTKQFRGQVERRLRGEIREEHFKPLRLQNGVYLQLHSYMFRIAIPYGQLNAARLRQLALIADKYDKGYGHFTTRQNIQFNWIPLANIPDVLDL